MDRREAEGHHSHRLVRWLDVGGNVMSEETSGNAGEAGMNETDTAEAVSAFGVGRVLSTGFSVLFSNFVPFVVLAVIITLPTYLAGIGVRYSIADTVRDVDLPSAMDVWNVVLAPLDLFLTSLVAAALSYGTYQYLNGRRTTLGECLRRGLPLIVLVIGVTVVYYVAMGIGMALFVIPGLVIMTIYFVSIPVAVVERPGVFASLTRSAELTHGYRWKVFATILVTLAIMMAVAIVLQGVLVTVATGSLFSPASEIAFGASFIIEAALSAFWAVIVAVMYFQLRTVKEGIDVAEIARVFD